MEEKVLHLRSKYHLGPMRIVWYLARYHGIRISDATVSRILKRHGVNRLRDRAEEIWSHDTDALIGPVANPDRGQRRGVRN
jgi:hypothetical protein